MSRAPKRPGLNQIVDQQSLRWLTETALGNTVLLCRFSLHGPVWTVGSTITPGLSCQCFANYSGLTLIRQKKKNVNNLPVLNMQWSQDLHQSIQYKHALHILKTCSNWSPGKQLNKNAIFCEWHAHVPYCISCILALLPIIASSLANFTWCFTWLLLAL